MQNVREMQKALINEKMDDIREMQKKGLINETMSAKCSRNAKGP
jgi:hypothetical protein